MIEHYSIKFNLPSLNFMERVLAQVSKNPRSFVIEDSPTQKTICFCSSADLAHQWTVYSNQGYALSYSIAYFTLTPEGILREPESGADEEFLELADMVKWILNAFSGWYVIDKDTGINVTQKVLEDPDILFLPDWERNKLN